MQPSLLDLPVTPAHESPVSTERRRLNAAAARVLAYLQAHEHATNVELCRPAVGGLRAIGRVHELRQDGWEIEKTHLLGGVWRYSLIGRKAWA